MEVKNTWIYSLLSIYSLGTSYGVPIGCTLFRKNTANSLEGSALKNDLGYI